VYPDVMGNCTNKFHAFSPPSSSPENGNVADSDGPSSSGGNPSSSSQNNNYHLTLSTRSNPSPPPFIASPFKTSSYRSSNYVSSLLTNEAYSPIYRELHFSSNEIQQLHDIFLHLLNTQPSPSSPSHNSQSNTPFEDKRVTFEHFYHSFNLQQTPLNDQLFSLWLPSSLSPSLSTTSFNFLYFICMIWYALAMDHNDVITYVFSLYSNHNTHLLTLSSIKTAMDHIHSFASTNKPLQKILQLLSESYQQQQQGGGGGGQEQTPLESSLLLSSHCSASPAASVTSSSSPSPSLSYSEWWEWCERYPLLLEPIYSQQTKLRQQICQEEIWLTIINQKEQTPSQHSPNYLHLLHGLYDEAMLKHTLTSRLNDLSHQHSSKSSHGNNIFALATAGSRSGSLSSVVAPSLRLAAAGGGSQVTEEKAEGSEEDYPNLSLRRKPSSRSSSTNSLQSMVIVSNCSTPFSVAGVVLQNKMYDTDGDSISVASVGSGRCSDFNSYQASLYEDDDALPGGRWAGEAAGAEGEEDGLLTPRSVLSNAHDLSDSEEEDQGR
jgi:hypothetical protein